MTFSEKVKEAKTRLRKIGYGLKVYGIEFKTYELGCHNEDHGDYQVDIDDAVETAEMNHRRGASCCANQDYSPGRECGISGAQ